MHRLLTFLVSGHEMSPRMVFSRDISASSGELQQLGFWKIGVVFPDEMQNWCIDLGIEERSVQRM
jgi:hypothetical protein